MMTTTTLSPTTTIKSSQCSERGRTTRGQKSLFSSKASSKPCWSSSSSSKHCSLCKRKGVAMSMVKNEDFKITKGQNKLKLYQFHTKVAKHYFCSVCGIYIHHHPRSNPTMTGFNLGCIDEIDTFNLKDIFLNDGLNHPLDKK